MASLGPTYPPRSARLPLPNLKPNELKIGNKPGVNILVVTDGGCGSNKLTDLGARCGSILRLDSETMQAWVCEDGSTSGCIGVHRGRIASMLNRRQHTGKYCSIENTDTIKAFMRRKKQVEVQARRITDPSEREFGLGQCFGFHDEKAAAAAVEAEHPEWNALSDEERAALVAEAEKRVETGEKLADAVDKVYRGTHHTMYWHEGTGEFTSEKPGWGYEKVEEGLEAPGVDLKRDKEDIDDLHERLTETGLSRAEQQSRVLPTRAPRVGPSGQIGGRKPRGRKRRTRRTRGRRRRSTYKRKRRVRRRGTRRR